MVSEEVSERHNSQAESSVDESFLAEPVTEPVAEPVAEPEIFTAGETTVIFKEESDTLNPKDTVPSKNTGTIGSDYFNSEDQWSATVVGETPTGNPLRIKKREGGSGYQLSAEKGPLPARYQGWYTSYDKAEVDARLYLNQLWEEHGASATSA